MGGGGGASTGGGGGSSTGDVDGGADAGVDGGMDVGCAAMEAEYLLAVERAKQCNPNSLINPCTETQPLTISCGCPTFINQGSGQPLVDLTAKYLDAGCVPTACPRCAVFDGGTCEPLSSNPSEGTCVDR